MILGKPRIDSIRDATISLMKVALVYDRVNKWGGAERVLLTLHEMFPEAPLFTSVYSKKNAPWAHVFPKIYTSYLQSIPFAKTNHELFPLFMPSAFESFNFDQYDLVVSVTSEAAKGIITKGKTKHICYCLTPTRYLWSGYEEYFGQKSQIQISNAKWRDWRRVLNRATVPFTGIQYDGFRWLSMPAVNHLRRWDKVAAQRPDVMIAISSAVQSRIEKYYGRKSEVVYPPIEVCKFKKRKDRDIYIDSPMKGTIARLRGNDREYYLIVSRLVPYKKVDLAIEAFNHLNLPLIIIGKGVQEKRLKRMAKGNITFIQNINDTELSNYYKNAKALIFPQEEDFGLVAVEAHASGVPLIAFKKGGVLDIVTHGKTGILFKEQRKESLIQAIHQLQKLKYKKEDLRNNAKKFSKEKFIKKFMKIIEREFA